MRGNPDSTKTKKKTISKNGAVKVNARRDKTTSAVLLVLKPPDSSFSNLI
jgi:hypothetical protein